MLIKTHRDFCRDYAPKVKPIVFNTHNNLRFRTSAVISNFIYQKITMPLGRKTSEFVSKHPKLLDFFAFTLPNSMKKMKMNIKKSP